MKIKQLAALSVIGMAAVSAITADSVLKSEVKKNQFGAMEVTETTENGSAKTVYIAQKSLH